MLNLLDFKTYIETQIPTLGVDIIIDNIPFSISNFFSLRILNILSDNDNMTSILVELMYKDNIKTKSKQDVWEKFYEVYKLFRSRGSFNIGSNAITFIKALDFPFEKEDLKHNIYIFSILNISYNDIKW